MYRFKPELRIPGPVPVPSAVSLQMARPVVNHREPFSTRSSRMSCHACSRSLAPRTPFT